MEVHDANARAIDPMIRKKRWAEQLLGQHCPSLRVQRWHWVVPPNARFTFPRGGGHAKKLALAGIREPVRRIEV